MTKAEKIAQAEIGSVISGGSKKLEKIIRTVAERTRQEHPKEWENEECQD
jgi:hypothetical protein